MSPLIPKAPRSHRGAKGWGKSWGSSPRRTGVRTAKLAHKHAVLMRLTIASDQAPAAADALVNDILPNVRSAPGFVSGYWLEPAGEQGFAFVLFETEHQAQEAVPPMTRWDAPGVTITSTEVRRVALTA